MDDRAILVMGAGDALGGAIARRFGREGYIACVARRDGQKLAPLVEAIQAEGGKAVPFSVDARKEDAVIGLVNTIEREIAPLEAVVFNIGANVTFPFLETTARVYSKVWEMACFAGFLTGREAVRVMLPRGRGTVIFTGASASLRGRPGYAAFNAAKHALRATAQSMAKEFAPQGLHVAHVIIDGAIDTAWIKENFPQRYALRDQGGILAPAHIAENYWTLHQQPRDAWTHELDLRPWMETW
ncbi:SDR family oxidoreductase [Xanthobacter aminoxidans]|uniref:SDR family oxidoreductase n=1 Tax=Xanthobacter aminoxidans TaxID=186280 RepID=UPI00372C5C51